MWQTKYILAVLKNLGLGLDFRQCSEGNFLTHVFKSGGNILGQSNQVRVVAVSLPQLTQASFLHKNRTLQNRFLISATLRWHRVSVAYKNQSF